MNKLLLHIDVNTHMGYMIEHRQSGRYWKAWFKTEIEGRECIRNLLESWDRNQGEEERDLRVNFVEFPQEVHEATY